MNHETQETISCQYCGYPEPNTPGQLLCACMECRWLGVSGELAAQACPKCDGHVVDHGTQLFTERLAARLTREGTEK